KHGRRMNIYYGRITRNFCKLFGVPPETPFKDIPKPIRKLLMHGTNPKDESQFGSYFEGVIPNLQRRWENTDSEYVKQRLHGYFSQVPCETCGGARLRVEALNVFVESLGQRYNIHDVTRM